MTKNPLKKYISTDYNKFTLRLNKVELEVGEAEDLREEVEVLGGTLTNTRNTLAELLTKVDNLQSEGGTTGQPPGFKKQFSKLTCFSCENFRERRCDQLGEHTEDQRDRLEINLLVLINSYDDVSPQVLGIISTQSTEKLTALPPKLERVLRT